MIVSAHSDTISSIDSTILWNYIRRVDTTREYSKIIPEYCEVKFNTGILLGAQDVGDPVIPCSRRVLRSMTEQTRKGYRVQSWLHYRKQETEFQSEPSVFVEILKSTHENDRRR